LATFQGRRGVDLALRLTPFGKSIAHRQSLDFAVNPNYVKLKFDDWRNRLFAWDFAESEFTRARERLAEHLGRYYREHGHEIVMVGMWRMAEAPPAMCGHLHTNWDGTRHSLVIVTDASTDRATQDRLEREWAAIALSLGGRPHIQKGDFAPEDFQSAFGAARIEAYRRVVRELDPAGTFAHPQLTRLLGLAYPR